MKLDLGDILVQLTYSHALRKERYFHSRSTATTLTLVEVATINRCVATSSLRSKESQITRKSLANFLHEDPLVQDT